MQPNLIVFDLDGTLINSIKDLSIACNYALKTLLFPTHTLTEYKKLVGNGIMRLIQKALPENKQNDPECVEQMKSHFISFYNQHLYDYSAPYKGITETLSKLKKQKWLLAVASNKYQQATEQIIHHFFPATFDVVFGEQENTPRKPNPTIINNIKKHLCLEIINKTYMVGDSQIDIQTAKNANLISIACTWGFVNENDLQKENPDFLINHPQDLLTILQ